MDNITIDGLEEFAFRRSIETMLRHGCADEAADRLKSLLSDHAGEGRILPARMLEVTADQIVVAGWDKLAERLGEYDRPEHQVTALGIGISDPEDAGVSPDEEGRLAPVIETTYFSDSAYPFSEAEREDLLEGYSAYGCEWQGNFEHSDSTLSVEGMDDLYGAIATLEKKVIASEEPVAQDIQAGTIGACYLGVLVFIAVRDTIVKNGLPRPLAVLLVNSDAYPFFDAPVMTRDEYRDNGAVKPVDDGLLPIPIETEEEDEGELAAAPTEYGSLLGVSVRKSEKKPVIMLEPGEAENAVHLEQLAAAEHMAAHPHKPAPAGALAGLSTLGPLDEEEAAFAVPGENREPGVTGDWGGDWGNFSEPAGPDGHDRGDEPPPPHAATPIDAWDAPPADRPSADMPPADIPPADMPPADMPPAEIPETEADEPEFVQFEFDASDVVNGAADADAPETYGETTEPAPDRDMPEDFAVQPVSFAEPADDEMPAWINETARRDEGDEIGEEFAAPPGFEMAEADKAAFQSRFEPRAHSLRARIVQTQPTRTARRGPVMAVLRWLYEWIKRS